MTAIRRKALVRMAHSFANFAIDHPRICMCMKGVGSAMKSTDTAVFKKGWFYVVGLSLPSRILMLAL